MKILRLVGGLALLVVAVLLLLLVATRLGVFNTRYADMVRDHAQPPSYFLDVQGAKVHVRDEGTGPTIVMLHSSMTNLHLWDAWADDLKKHYRVVRMDWPPYGLTVDYSGQQGTPHAAAIVNEVVDKLKLDNFVLVGSSSGATLSVVYAATHPDKVRALALSSLPLKPPPNIKDPIAITSWGWIHQNLIPNYYPRMYWRPFLERVFGDSNRITDAEVKFFADTNNLEGGYARVLKYYKSNVAGVWTPGKGSAGSYASRVTAPILLQWGDLDPVLPPYLAAEAVTNFKNAKVTVIHYPQGHYPMIENPAPTLHDLEAFLAALPPAPVSQPSN